MQLFNGVLFFSVILLPVFHCDVSKRSEDEKSPAELAKVNVTRESFAKDASPLQFKRDGIPAGKVSEAAANDPIESYPLPTTARVPNGSDSNVPDEAPEKMNEDFQSSPNDREQEGDDTFAHDGDLSNNEENLPHEPSANLHQDSKESLSRTKGEQHPKSPDDEKGERIAQPSDTVNRPSEFPDASITDGPANVSESKKDKQNLLRKNGAENSNHLRTKLQQIFQKFGKTKRKPAHLGNTRNPKKKVSANKSSNHNANEQARENTANPENETDTNESPSLKNGEEEPEEKSLIAGTGVHQNPNEDGQPKILPVKNEDSDSKENRSDTNESPSLKNGEENPDEKLKTDTGALQNPNEDSQAGIPPLENEDNDSKGKEPDTTESPSLKNGEENPDEKSLKTDAEVLRDPNEDGRHKILPLENEGNRSWKNGEENSVEKPLKADTEVLQNPNEDSQPKILPLKNEDSDKKGKEPDINKSRPLKNEEESPDEKSLKIDTGDILNPKEGSQPHILLLENEGNRSLKNGEENSAEKLLKADTEVLQNPNEDSQPEILPLKNEDSDNKGKEPDTNESRSLKNGEGSPIERPLKTDAEVLRNPTEDSQPKILPLENEGNEPNTNGTRSLKNGEENSVGKPLKADIEVLQNHNEESQPKISPLENERSDKEGKEPNTYESPSLKNGEENPDAESLKADPGVLQNHIQDSQPKNDANNHLPVDFPPREKADAAKDSNDGDNASVADEERANPKVEEKRKNEDDVQRTSIEKPNNVKEKEDETNDHKESTDDTSKPDTKSNISSAEGSNNSQQISEESEDDTVNATDVSAKDLSEHTDNDTDENEISPDEENQSENPDSQIEYLNDNSTLASDNSFIEESEDKGDEGEARAIAGDDSIEQFQPEEDDESINNNSEDKDLISVENFSHEGSQNGTRDIPSSERNNDPLLLDDGNSTFPKSSEDSEVKRDENEVSATESNTRGMEPPNDDFKTSQISLLPIVKGSETPSEDGNLNKVLPGNEAPSMANITRDVIPPPPSVKESDKDGLAMHTPNEEASPSYSDAVGASVPKLLNIEPVPDELLNSGEPQSVHTDAANNSSSQLPGGTEPEDLHEDNSPHTSGNLFANAEEKFEDISEDNGKSETVSEERNSSEASGTTTSQQKSTSIDQAPFVYKSMFISYFSPGLQRLLSNRTQFPTPQFFPYGSENDAQQQQSSKQPTESKDSEIDDATISSDEDDLSTEPGMWNRALFRDDESSQETSDNPSNNVEGTLEKDFITAASMPSFTQPRSNSSTDNGEELSPEMDLSHLPTEEIKDDPTRSPDQTEGDLSTAEERHLPTKENNDDSTNNQIEEDLPTAADQSEQKRPEPVLPANTAREMPEETNQSGLSTKEDENPTESFDATDEDFSEVTDSPSLEAGGKPTNDSLTEIPEDGSKAGELHEENGDPSPDRENSFTDGKELPAAKEGSKSNAQDSVRQNPVQFLSENNQDHRTQPSLGAEYKPSTSYAVPKDTFENLNHEDQPRIPESNLEMKNNDNYPAKPTTNETLLPRDPLKKPAMRPLRRKSKPKCQGHRSEDKPTTGNSSSQSNLGKEDEPKGGELPTIQTTIKDPVTVSPPSLQDDVPEDNLSENASSPNNELPRKKVQDSKEKLLDTIPSDDNIYQREMSLPIEDEARRDVNDQTQEGSAEAEDESEIASTEGENKLPAGNTNNNQVNSNPFQTMPSNPFPSFFPPVFSPFMRSFNQPPPPTQSNPVANNTPPTNISTPSPAQPSYEDDASEEDPSSEESAEKNPQTAGESLNSRDQISEPNIDVAPQPKPSTGSPPVYKSMFVSFLTPPASKRQPAIRSSFFSSSVGDNPFWSAMQQIVGIGVKNAGALLEGAGKVSEAGFDATKDVFDMVKTVPIVRDVISPVKKFTENGLDVADQTVTGSLLSIGSYINGQGQTTRERSLGHDRYRYRYPNSNENDGYDARQTRSTPTSIWTMGKYATNNPAQTTQQRSVTQETPYSRYRYSYNWK